MGSAATKASAGRVRFGDVVRQVKDKVDPLASGLERYVAGEHMDTDDLRLRRWGEINGCYLGPAFHMRFKPGHVLYGSRRTYLRKVAIADFSGICANTTFVLEPKDPSVLLPEFLSFLMHTEEFHTHSIKQSKGSVNPYVNFSDLAWWEFALPPLDEQESLCRLLKGLGAVEDAYRAAESATRRLRDSMRASLFRSSSERIRLAEVLRFITSGSRGWSRFYADEGDLFFRIANLNSPTIDVNLSNVQRVAAPRDAEAERANVHEGDVLLGITGEAGLGLVGFVRTLNERAFVSQHIALIRVDRDKYDPRFVAHALASGPGQQQIARFNQAGAKAGMTLIAVRELELPAMELSRQVVAADELDTIESGMQTLRQRREQARALVHLQLAQR